MQTKEAIIIGIIAGLILTANCIAAEQTLLGHWAGEIRDGDLKEMGSGWRIHVLFRYKEDVFSSTGTPTLSAIVDIPKMQIRDAESGFINFVSDSELSFYIRLDVANLMVFDGELGERYPSKRSDMRESKDEIFGTCTIGDTIKTFILWRREDQ